MAERVRRLARSGDVFVYFKHEETPEGALHAEALLRAGPEGVSPVRWELAWVSFLS